MSDDVSRSWSASVGLPTGVGPDDSFCIPDGDDALANFFPGLDRIPLCARGCMADAFQRQQCRSNDSACLCSHSIDIQELAVDCAQEKCGHVQTQETINYYISSCKEEDLDLQSAEAASNTIRSGPSKLSQAAIIGIAFGLFGALLALSAVSIFLYLVRRRQQCEPPGRQPSLSQDPFLDRPSSEPQQVAELPSSSKPLIISSSKPKSPFSPLSPGNQELETPSSPCPPSSSRRAFFPDPSPVLPPLPTRSSDRAHKAPSVEVPLGLHYIGGESRILPGPRVDPSRQQDPHRNFQDTNNVSPSSPAAWRDNSFGGSLWDAPDNGVTCRPEERQDYLNQQTNHISSRDYIAQKRDQDCDPWRFNGHPAGPVPDWRNMI